MLNNIVINYLPPPFFRLFFISLRSFKRLKEKKKDLLLIQNKLIEEIPDPRNAKQHYQSFIRKKNRKSLKQSKIIIYQQKTFENSNTVDIKAIITEHPKEHPKTLHKLFKTIRQAEKVGSYSSLYSDTKKRLFFKRKKM